MPKIEFNTEIKQAELINARTILADIEIQIVEYKKKKLEIGEELNETLVASIEKQLETLRSSVTTEIRTKLHKA